MEACADGDIELVKEIFSDYGLIGQ